MVNVKVGKYLSVDNMNDIYDNIVEINSLLPDIHIAAETLKDSSVTFGISPLNILDKMNAVEYNIRVIHNKLSGIKNWKDANFKVFIWQPITFDKSKEIQRWINWVNDCFAMIKNVTVSKNELLISDGSPLLSEDGKQIYYIERSI